MFKTILLALVASTTSAHSTFEDDPDAALITNREGSAKIDSGRASNIQTQSEKFSLMYKFSDESESKQRGDFELVRNSKTNEIVKVNLNNDQNF